MKKQQEYFWNAQKNLVKNELDESNVPLYRISSALSMIREYSLLHCEDAVKSLLDSNNETLLCEAVSTLKHLDKLDGTSKEAVLQKVKDENKKALINSLF